MSYMSIDSFKIDYFSQAFQVNHFLEILKSYYLGCFSAYDILTCSYDLPFYYELRLEDYIIFDAL